MVADDCDAPGVESSAEPVIDLFPGAAIAENLYSLVVDQLVEHPVVDTLD